MTITRRAALLGLPLAVSGCSLFDSILNENKAKIPGKRESVLGASTGLTVDASSRAITVPPLVNLRRLATTRRQHPPTPSAMSASPASSPVWTADIGAGGGYRAKLTAQPMILNGTAYTMDSDGTVSAFDLARGSRRWRTDTAADDSRSTNIGGGVAHREQPRLCHHRPRRRPRPRRRKRQHRLAPSHRRPRPLRPHAGQRPHALHHHRRPAHRPQPAHRRARLGLQPPPPPSTTVLTDAAPAISDGFVVAGFGSGETRHASAPIAASWSGATRSPPRAAATAASTSPPSAPCRSSDQGRVYAIGVGGIIVALDLRSGRRLWEREIGGGQTPWLAGDWLFVQTTGQALAAIDATDGRVRWTQDLPRWDNPAKQRDAIFWSGPLMANGKLILAGTSAIAVSVNPLDGHILGTQNMSERRLRRPRRRRRHSADPGR